LPPKPTAEDQHHPLQQQKWGTKLEDDIVSWAPLITPPEVYLSNTQKWWSPAMAVAEAVLF